MLYRIVFCLVSKWRLAMKEPEATFPWGPGLRRLVVAALFSGFVGLASPYTRPEGHVEVREPAHWTPTPGGQ